MTLSHIQASVPLEPGQELRAGTAAGRVAGADVYRLVADKQQLERRRRPENERRLLVVFSSRRGLAFFRWEIGARRPTLDFRLGGKTREAGINRHNYGRWAR